MHLWVYAVRRIALAIPVVLGILTVVFVIICVLPRAEIACTFYPSAGPATPCTTTTPCLGNPGSDCPNPVYERAVQQLGLQRPIFVQYAIYLADVFTFHLGYVSPDSALGTGSTNTGLPALAGQSVTTVIGEFLPYTVELVLLTFFFTLLIVIPLQKRARAHPGGTADRIAFALSLPGVAIPLFLVGSLALAAVTFAAGGPAAPSAICGGQSTVFLDFYGSWPQPPCVPLYGTASLGPVGYPIWLHMGFISTPTGFPTVDALLHGNIGLAVDTLARMVLPALVLTFVTASVVLRYARYSRIERTDLEFLRGARSRGLPESEVTRRISGRSSAAEVSSTIGPALLMTLGMVPVVELLFNLWGIGTLFVYAFLGGVRHWDPGILLGILVTSTLLVVVVRVVMDVVHAYLDPRFRQEVDNRRPEPLPRSTSGTPRRSELPAI